MLTGCVLPPPAPPDPPLSKQTVGQLAKCQSAVKKSGRTFVSKKLKGLEGCLDKVLELQLQKENGLITLEKFDKELDKVRKSCDKDYEAITKASTKFVDGVVKECGPVEGVLLGSDDPLQFQAWQAEFGGAPFANAEELAGFTCSAKEALADFMVAQQVPRMCEILTTLGPTYVVVDVDAGVCIPNVPLDTRCPPLVELTSTTGGAISSRSERSKQRLRALRAAVGAMATSGIGPR